MTTTMNRTTMANNGAIPEFTVPTIRRVSYVLPNVQQPLRYFALPSTLQASQGQDYTRTGPLLLSHPNSSNLLKSHRNLTADDEAQTSLSSHHPKHTLPISSLALDDTTVVQQHDDGNAAPRGILYAGGRDGMISAWDLGLTMVQTQSQSSLHPLGSEEFDDEVTKALLCEDSDDYHGNHRSRRYGNVQNGIIGDQVDQGESKWQLNTSGRHREPKASFRQCIGSHTDWINEILLCNANQTVVSASSDGNVNIWNPHDAQSSLVPQVLGTHSDYVKSLAHAPTANWIASGSFDKTIKLWDIKEPRHDPVLALSAAEVGSSVYSMATNVHGAILAGGSPDRVVRMWDPRSGRKISQLVGHSDAVRRVVMSQDGTHLLTASSDATIRLWSVGEQRCLHTFTHHTESVWALHSDHPRLDIFYSGDRTGLLCKVDWERCNEVSEGECVVLARDGTAGDDGQAKFRGESSSSGIHDITSFDNGYVWTASANGSVKRWRDVGSCSSREALHPLVAPAPPRRAGQANEPSLFRDHQTVQSGSNTAGSSSGAGTHSPLPEHTHQAEKINGLYGIPFDSLVCLAPPNDPYGAAIGLGSISMRHTSRGGGHPLNETNTIFSSASLISIPSTLPNTQGDKQEYESSSNLQQQTPQEYKAHASSPPNLSVNHPRHESLASFRPASVRSGSLRFAPHDTRHEYHQGTTYQEEKDNNTKAEDTDDDDEQEQGDGDEAVLEARLAFEERELAIDAQPLRERAEDVIYCAHGLIRSTLLNDRRHCLTIDSAGAILLWDIVAGQSLGAFTWMDMVEAACDAGLSKDVLPGEALDIVKERIQGYGAAPIWCTVDTKTGSLSVHLEYPRCFDAEVYLDECNEILQQSPHSNFVFQDDQRINTGRLLCKSLFAGFANRERELRSGSNVLLPSGKLAIELDRVASVQAKQTDAKRSLSSSGMRINTAVGPKSPAVLPVHSPLSPTNTHHLSSLQKLVLQQQQHTMSSSTASADETNNGNSGDYFSLQRTAENSNPQVTTPRGGKKDTQSITPGGSVVSPGGSKLMDRLRLGLRRDATLSRKQAPKSPTNGIIASSPTKSSAHPKSPGEGASSALASGDIQFESETQQQLYNLHTLLAQVGRPLTTPGTKSIPSTPSATDSASKERKAADDDVPLINFSPNTALIISESSPDSGGYQVKYRGLVGSTQHDTASLELQSPRWLLEQVLSVGDAAQYGGASREKDKLTFVLVPWESGEPASGKMSDAIQTTSGLTNAQQRDSATTSSDDQRMAPISTGNSRLTATRMLRAKKVCAYVADRLHLIDMPQRSESHPGAAMSRTGSSSIVASRRASAAQHELGLQGKVQLATSSGFDAHSAAHLQNALQQQQQQSILQLRRPSAISIAALSSSSESGQQHEVPSFVMPSEAKPHEFIEVLCKEEVIPFSMTLAQVQRYIWKSGAAIKLEYRWKAGVERQE